MKTLNKTVREDGLRVITKKLNGSKRVIVCVSALAGSANDPVDKEGLFHFFEHMGFKGTARRSMSDVKEVLGLLLRSNAYTADLRTTYFGEAVYTKLPLLQDIIFDIYTNSIFPLEEIEKEKEVVLNEAAMREDQDSHKAYSMLGKILWEKNPARRVGVGTAEGLAKIDRKILIDTHKYWYDSSNTVVVAAGRIDHEKFVKESYATFPLSRCNANKVSWVDEADILPVKRFSVIERKNREKGVVVWGCKIPKLSDKEKIATYIISSMLGGGFDSLLWSEVREKRGLVYSARSHLDVNNLASLMTFHADMMPNRVEEVKSLMRDVICDHELREQHFNRVKTVTGDAFLLSQEDLGDWINLIHNKIVDDNQDSAFLDGYINKRIKMLRSISFEEVLEMRKKLLCNERMACAVVKPV